MKERRRPDRDDPDVLFADNFESDDMMKWDQKRGRVVTTETQPNAGRWCVQMPMERVKNHGGDAIKGFMPGADAVDHRRHQSDDHDSSAPAGEEHGNGDAHLPRRRLLGSLLATGR